MNLSHFYTCGCIMVYLLKLLHFSFDSSSASCTSPTGSVLRALARLFKDGLRSELLNHSFRVCVKQLSVSLWLVCRMASRVPGVRPSCNPILYHLDRPSHTALWIDTKSTTVSRQKVSSTYNICKHIIVVIANFHNHHYDNALAYPIHINGAITIKNVVKAYFITDIC